MSGKQDNKRELTQEEMSMVNGGDGSANDQAKNAIPVPIDPVVPVPVPVPDDTTGKSGMTCKCGHCGYIIDSADAAGIYNYDCPNCRQRANWIYNL